jgi:1-acyl-sn-glycerol-3-phosphate acyltransferase
MKSRRAFFTFTDIYRHTYRELKKIRVAESQEPDLAMKWAQGILDRINVDLEVSGEPYQGSSVLYVGNHISYVDIPLLMGTIEQVAFVAKSQIRKWPLFGEGAARIGTVFVKRNRTSSRDAAKRSLTEAIERGKKVAVFPSGTTSLAREKPWRKGAFDIAHATGCSVQPFRLTYEPLRDIAYIDDDFFPTHLLRLTSHDRIRAKIEFHEPVKITDPIADCNKWQAWAQPANIPF